MRGSAKIVALGTLRAALSSRMLVAIVLLNIVMVWIGLVFEFLPKEEKIKIIFDMGLAMTAFFSVAVGVFLAGWSFPEELGNRKILLVLSKPVSRGEFFMGKLLGLLGSCMLAVLAMGIFVTSVIVFKYKLSPQPALLALYMNSLELLVIVSVSVLFSVWFSGRAAVMLTIITYLVGHSSATFLAIGAKSSSAAVLWATHVSYLIVPNLEVFNVRHIVIHRLEMPWTLTISASLYALTYAGAILCVAYRLFIRKEL